MSVALMRALASEFDPLDKRLAVPCEFYLDHASEREGARLANKKLVHWYCLPIVRVEGTNRFFLELRGQIPATRAVLAQVEPRGGSLGHAPNEGSLLSVLLTVDDATLLRTIADDIERAVPPRPGTCQRV